MKLPRPHKYGARKVEIDGLKFDSTAEGEYYQELKLLQRAGEIKLIETQPKVYLTAARILYKPDFLIEHEGDHVWIDVKGFQTRDFNLKLRLWNHYGPGELWIVKKGRYGFHKDFKIVPGKGKVK